MTVTFNLNPNYYTTITGNETDFFNGTSSITVSRGPNQAPGFSIICDDWSAVKSITVTSNLEFVTRNYGYYDTNKTWVPLMSTPDVVTFSNNNYTVTFNLTDAIRSDIYRIYAQCGQGGDSATYSNFSYTDVHTPSATVPKIGSDDVSKIYLGTEEINKIYLGSEIIYEAS